jgi:predicted ATP-dependent Lon-type protease
VHDHRELFYEEGQKTSPFSLFTLKPIQMPSMDMEEVFEARKQFDRDQWIDVLLRSVGMEPANIESAYQMASDYSHDPFVENNYNVCELGPRGTGKSHVYKVLTELIAGIWRANHGGEPVLQHGQPSDWSCGHVGRGRVR